jgi:hypothetical protein
MVFKGVSTRGGIKKSLEFSCKILKGKNGPQVNFLPNFCYGAALAKFKLEKV